MNLKPKDFFLLFLYLGHSDVDCTVLFSFCLSPSEEENTQKCLGWLKQNGAEGQSENLPSTISASAGRIKTIVSQMEVLTPPPLWPIPFSLFVFSNPVSFCSLGKCHISATICCMFSMWKSGEQPRDKNHITMRGSWTWITPELPHRLSRTCSRH